jgi:GATA-binding protein
MSGAAAQYEERGGLLQPIHASQETTPNATGSQPKSNPTSSTSTSTTEHDFRFPRRPAEQQPPEGSTSDAATAQSGTVTSTKASGASTLDKLDPSAANSVRKELLRESFFPTWKDDTAGEELDSPDEMQKKDPLATQIWRLYSKTKKQLPNQERMENLTWRMMAMSLRKRRQEEAARYVSLRKDILHTTQDIHCF